MPDRKRRLKIFLLHLVLLPTVLYTGFVAGYSWRKLVSEKRRDN